MNSLQLKRTPSGNGCVTVLLPTHEFGGHEKMLKEVLVEALRQGLPCHGIFGRDIPELVHQFSAANLPIRPAAYKSARSGSRLIGTLKDLATTWHIVRKAPRESTILFAPGVVQAQVAHIALARLMGARVGIYVPMTYRSDEMGFRFAKVRDFVVRSVVYGAAFWVTITAQQSRLLKQQWRVRGPVHVVPNRLQLPAAEAVERPMAEQCSAQLRVLFLGRFDRNQKGLDWLIDAIRERHAELLHQVEFVFQGKGEFEHEIRALRAEFGERMVRIAKWGDVAEELSSADVLLLTSRFEGFPLVAVEATHYSVPIVASNKSGLEDVLLPGSLFDFGDTSAMFESILKMRSQVTRRAAVHHTANKLKELLSEEKFATSLSVVNREIAGSASRG